MSSSVNSLRYRAFGFESPWRLFFTLTAAKSFVVVP